MNASFPALGRSATLHPPGPCKTSSSLKLPIYTARTSYLQRTITVWTPCSKWLQELATIPVRVTAFRSLTHCLIARFIHRIMTLCILVPGTCHRCRFLLFPSESIFSFLLSADLPLEPPPPAHVRPAFESCCCMGGITFISSIFSRPDSAR